jgi:hypothetical protein
MAVYHLNMADENLVDAIVDQVELEKRVPGYTDFLDGVQDMAGLMEEASTLGKYTKQTGFTRCRTMQRIASIPWSVACAVREIDPEFFKSPEKVGRFLKRHPEYATVRTIK